MGFFRGAVSFSPSRSMSPAGRIGIGAILGASALAAVASLWKLLAIGGTAFVAMAVGAWLGARAAPPAADAGATVARRLVWGYGLASGAMITSASVFLVPSAINHHAAFGGFGIAAGVLLGFALHVLQHHLAYHRLPFDGTTLELTIHALAAGLVIGAVYATMPALGAMLGLAIVSHKAPAGYAAACRLRRSGQAPSALLIPAAAVAVTAVPVGLVSPPESAVVHALVFGLATGVFLHVALDFLPQCEIGGELLEAAGWTGRGPAPEGDFDAHHHLLDRLRLHAVASTTVGGGIVFLAWWGLHV